MYSQSILELYSYQKATFEGLLEASKVSKFIISNDEAGTGKSFLAMKLSQSMNIPLLYICDKKIRPTIQKYINDYNIQCHKIYTYAGVYSKNSDLIEKNKVNNKVVFKATNRFIDLLNKGVLIVVDEYDGIKNSKALKSRAIKCLLLELSQLKCVSRALFLGAIAYEKEEHVIDFCKAIGFIKHSVLVKKAFLLNSYTLLGLEELLQSAYKYTSKEMVENFMKEYKDDFYNGRFEWIAVLCFKKLILPKMRGPRMVNKDILPESDVKNGYYNLDSNFIESYKNAINKLIEDSGYDIEEKNIVDVRNIKDNSLGINLQPLEINKLSLFNRLMKKYLDSNSNIKGIIAVNYRHSLAILSEMLKEYNPLLLHGDLNEKDRFKIQELFQSNNLENRILITTISLSDKGVNYHDLHGNRPRVMLISPNYNYIQMYQIAYRVMRTGSQTGSIIRYIYVKGMQVETNILTALSRKRSFVNFMNDDEQKTNTNMDEYPNEIEE